MRQSGGLKLTGGGQTEVGEHQGVVQSCVPELWASVKKSRSHRLYCDEEAGLALDSHWIAEPRGSERSGRSAVQVAVRRIGGLLSKRRELRVGSAVQVAVRCGGSCRVGTCS